jgi:hypothetical protein
MIEIYVPITRLVKFRQSSKSFRFFQICGVPVDCKLLAFIRIILSLETSVNLQYLLPRKLAAGVENDRGG